MRFIEKTDYNLSISNSSVNALNAYKIKSIFLLSLDFAADSSRYIWMLSNLIWDRVAINIRWKLKHFQIMYRPDSDYLTKLFFHLRVR